MIDDITEAQWTPAPDSLPRPPALVIGMPIQNIQRLREWAEDMADWRARQADRMRFRRVA